MNSKTEQKEKLKPKNMFIKCFFIFVHAPLEACILHINSTEMYSNDCFPYTSPCILYREKGIRDIIVYLQLYM